MRWLDDVAAKGLLLTSGSTATPPTLGLAASTMTVPVIAVVCTEHQ